MNIFKALYQELMGIIDANIPEVKWIDVWRNQVGMMSDAEGTDYDRLPFPAVFFKLRIPGEAGSKGVKSQDGEVIIDVYVWDNSLGRSHHGSKTQDDALDHINVMGRVHEVLHNVSGVNFSTMNFLGPDPIETGGRDVLNKLMFRSLVSWYKEDEYIEVENPALDVQEGEQDPDIEDDPLFDILNPLAPGDEDFEPNIQTVVKHTDSDGTIVEKAVGEPMICTPFNFPNVLQTADLDDPANETALLANPDIDAFIEEYKTCPTTEAVITSADFSLESNYNAFRTNSTAKAAPLRLPIQLRGSHSYNGDLDYLYAAGRFDNVIIDGRIKCKQLTDFLTLHPDNPRPDGNLNRFQTGTYLGELYYIDWLQELFYYEGSNMPMSFTVNGTNQEHYGEMTALHPMFRFPRLSEVDLLKNYAVGRIHGSTSNNYIKTLEINTENPTTGTRVGERLINGQTTYNWGANISYGCNMICCYLEEIANDIGITLP